MSVTLVNNSPQLTVATAGTRGLTGAHVVSAAFSGSNLIITLSDGTVVNAGGAILSSSGSNNWVGQQAVNGNVIVTGSFIVSGSNTFINIGPTILSGSVNAGTTSITGSLIVSGGTINVIGSRILTASQDVTLANTMGYSTFSQSLSQSISHSVANLSSSIGSLSGSVAGTIDNKISSLNETNSTFVSKSIFNTFATSSNSRITSLESESSNVRVTLNSYTQSQGLRNARYEASHSAAIQSASLFNDVSASYAISASSLFLSASALQYTSSITENRLASLRVTTGSMNSFSQSVSAVTNSLQIATASLFTSASSLKLSASNHETRLAAIEFDSSSWGTSTNVSLLNTFATSSLASITALQITASVLVAYTTSSDSDINNLELSASSLVVSASSLRTSASTALSTNTSQASSITALNTFSASVSSVTNSLQLTTSSLNAFTASVNSTTTSLNVISSSLLVSASSLSVSASSFTTYITSSVNRLNSIESTTASLNTYTASLKAAIEVSGGTTTILGNLVIQGTQTSIDATNLKISDKLIEIASGSTNSVTADGAGIYISGADASITWNNATSKIATNKGISITGDISVSGLVDGTDIAALSSSFHTTSGSYNSVSGAINTIINGLNNYTSSSGINILNLNTISASYLTFTQSYYSSSASMDDRVTDLEASVGGGGTGISVRVGRLETSASQAALTNSLQANVISSVGAQIGQLIQTASSLAGNSVGTTNQLNSLNASASSVFQSASSLVISASNSYTNNQSQNASIGSINNFTQSFTAYSQSVSSSIAQISSSIAGGNITLQLNSVTSSIQSINNFTSSFNDGVNSTGSRIINLEWSASNQRGRISTLETASSNLINYSQSVIPGVLSTIDGRFLNFSSSLAEVSNSAFSDAQFIIYSQSAVTTSVNLYNSGSNLSASIWAPTFSGSVGLSSSINQKIQSVSSSITTRINTIVVGTGFIERPEFNTVTSSLFTSASALSTTASANRTSSSVLFTSASSLNLSASALQTTASGILSYTASLKGAINAVGADLYVSGNIIAQQYIVSTSTYYVTESNFEGDHNFGDQYGDSQVLNGITTINGALILNVSSSNPVSNPSFVSISADIRVVSGAVIAPIFKGTFDGAYSSSIQTNISGTTGFSNFTSSISESINTATSSLSSSVSSSIGLLSASVANINSTQVSTASLNTITSSLYDTTQSLNNSVISLYAFSASVTNSLQALNIYTSSVDVFAGTVVATGSIMNTFSASVNSYTSSLNSYTSSLKAAIQPNGSNLNVSGNLFVSGNIVAQNYIVSSSVTYMTTSFSSGSTVFGNDSSDTHQLTGSVYISGAFNLKDVASELNILGNGFGQTSLTSPNGALVLTPGLYGVQINGTYPDLQANGNITANGYISGAIRATNGLVSSSGQFIEYGALLTSSVSGKQAVSGTLIVSGNTSLTGSVGVDLRSGSEFYVRNGVTRIDSVLFVTDNDYVNSAYVGGDIKVNDYLAGGYTAHYDGGVQITGSLRVNAGQNGSGSYFTGSVQITGNEAVSGNLAVLGTSTTARINATIISASSYLTASALQIEGNTRINGFTDLRNGLEVRGIGVNDEARFYVTSLRAEGNTALSGTLEVRDQNTTLKSVTITDLSMSRIPYVDSTDTLTDNANFTYNGVTFKVGGGAFEIDDATGNIRTSGSLSVGALNISNNLNVAGAVGLQSTLTVTGSTLISSSLRATSTASFGALTVTGSSVLGGRLQVGTNAAISGNLGVSGSVALSSSLFVSGNITASANANISGDVAITGSLSAVGPIIQLGNLPFVDRTIISGALELSGSYHTMTTNLKATGSNNPADAIYRLTEAQAWSASFTTNNTSSGAWIRTPDEYLEYFVGQGSNKRRYITPVWIDESLYADDYFDISVVSGADSDYVY
jgi:hypothetical protein